jgi:hypothetical protein
LLVEEEVKEKAEVEEDEIDKILKKEDGWVVKNNNLTNLSTRKIEDLGILMRKYLKV